MSDSEALLTSVQYSTWKICSQIAENYDVTFSKEFMCTLGKLGFEQIGILAEDLESFAKHGKRTIINSDDVKLLVRRIPNLQRLIEEMSPKTGKQKKNDKRKKVGADEDSKDGDHTATTSKGKINSKRKKIVVVDEVID